MPEDRATKRILLTDRACHDLQQIHDYSVTTWGQSTADKYLGRIERTIERIHRDHALLQPIPEFHQSLKFYRAGKHLLVCETRDDSITILTVIHASMDIPRLLAVLEPTLVREAEMLRQAWDSKQD